MRPLFAGLGILGAAIVALVLAKLFGNPFIPSSILSSIPSGIASSTPSAPPPNEYYDNVEAKLIIDGEPITVSGTAFCSITESYDRLAAIFRKTIKRNGGAAVSLMSDGRAVVIPYSDWDYCRRPSTIDLYFDEDFSGWWDNFEKRFSLKGNIDILIMDDGDAPTSAEVLLGPEYFQDETASIKLISAERWRAKSGEVTVSSLGWFRANDIEPELPPGLLSSSDHPNLVSRSWVGAYINVLPAEHYENDPAFNWLVKYLSDYGDWENPPQAPEGKWRQLIRNHPHTTTRPVQLSGRFIRLKDTKEPFRIPLEPRRTEAGMWFRDRQWIASVGNCSGPSNRIRWSSSGQKTFLPGDGQSHVSEDWKSTKNIVPVRWWVHKNTDVYFDTKSRALIHGEAICAKPSWALPLIEE